MEGHKKSYQASCAAYGVIRTITLRPTRTSYPLQIRYNTITLAHDHTAVLCCFCELHVHSPSRCSSRDAPPLALPPPSASFTTSPMPSDATRQPTACSSKAHAADDKGPPSTRHSAMTGARLDAKSCTTSRGWSTSASPPSSSRCRSRRAWPPRTTLMVLRELRFDNRTRAQQTQRTKARARVHILYSPVADLRDHQSTVLRVAYARPLARDCFVDDTSGRVAAHVREPSTDATHEARHDAHRSEAISQ